MTTPTQTAPAVTLTPAEIERLELEARGNVIAAATCLAALRDGGAHTAAGLSWPAYVLDRFGDVLAQLRLELTDRRELAAHLRGSVAEGRDGLSLAALAEVLGIGKSTARRLVREADTGDYPERTTGLDNRRRAERTADDEAPAPATTPAEVAEQLAVEQAAPAEEVPAPSRLAVLIALVAAAGEAGRTAVSLEDETGWRHGSVSAALHRAATGARPRLAYLPAGKRGQTGRYVTPANLPTA